MNSYFIAVTLCERTSVEWTVECGWSGCSNVSERYLIYGNPVRWPSVAVNDKEELAALRAALALGQMLNRVVVLPRFHCARSAVQLLS